MGRTLVKVQSEAQCWNHFWFWHKGWGWGHSLWPQCRSLDAWSPGRMSDLAACSVFSSRHSNQSATVEACSGFFNFSLLYGFFSAHFPPATHTSASVNAKVAKYLLDAVNCNCSLLFAANTQCLDFLALQLRDRKRRIRSGDAFGIQLHYPCGG